MPSPRLLFVAVFVACRDDGTPTDPLDTDSPTAEALLEGAYTGTVLGKENDTCGDLFVYVVAPEALSAEVPDDATPIFLSIGAPYLSYTSDSRFTLDYGGGITQRCDQADGEVTCKGYEAAGSPISVRSRIRDFVVTSDRSFTQREVVEFDCVGGVCADSGTFPCTMELPERFEYPLTEVDYCFDGLDNDLDNRANNYDVDCPPFLPEFWSVSGEFGYDAAAGGVVPFVEDGVVHPPVLSIGITAAVYYQGTAYASVDSNQTCTVTLTYTGTDPIPTTVESVPGVDAAGEPVTELRHTFRMPPGQFAVTTDCPDKRLFRTDTFGTLDDIAAAGWGLGVGTATIVDPLAPDTLGAAARFGIVGEWAESGPGLGYAVDADLNVLNEAGEVATLRDVELGTLGSLSATSVSGESPLPSGAYVVRPTPEGYRYGH
jgi:hypothetical protein